MSTPNSRKRAAPGSTPILPVTAAQPTANFNTSAQDQLLRWQNGINGIADPSAFLMSAAQGQFIQPPTQQMLPQQGILHQMQPMQQVPTQQQQQQLQQPQPLQQAPSTSTAITRRPPNRALIPSAPRPPFDPTTDSWIGFGGEETIGNGNVGAPGENESIDVLEERAQRIKKDAQAKRKPIPPFVQKLSSFLEEQKNTELIRWSESGDSFIVLDEDEFAKTLIPELFKHNNYASFVRQLNMYGFHKRVGLSDNSMKASERKNKSPSEYFNPYFKRGHPNLLWLINKPKSGSKSKKGKKDDGDGDSDEELVLDEPQVHGLPGVTNPQSRTYGPGTSEVGPLQRKDFQLIKDELSTLQTRQAQISKVMQRLVSDNAQLQSQAHIFQTMHERHENSINAILNFLANVFRKSLEEQGSVQGVTELLASILPNGQMPQGSVVDVSDDFDRPRVPTTTAMGTPHKRQRLLPPIPAHSTASSPSTRSGSAAPTHQASTTIPSAGRATSNIFTEPMGTVTELFDSPGDLGSTSSTYLQKELQANPQEGMMKIIQDTNANTPSSSNIDLPEMAAVTNVNLSNDQRNRVLSIMSGHNRQGSLNNLNNLNNLNALNGQNTAHIPPTPASTAATASLSDQFAIPAVTLAGGMSQALPSHAPVSTPVSSVSPGADANFAGLSITPEAFGDAMSPGIGASNVSAAANISPSTAPASLSPILSQIGNVPPPPSLQDIANTQTEIEALQRLQEEQNTKITDLSQLLGPLSPSGRVPGIDEDGTIVGAGGGSSGHTGGGNGVIAGGQSPGYFDLGQYLDPTAFGDDFNFATGDLGTSGIAVTGAAHPMGGVAGATTGVEDDDFNFGLDSSALKASVGDESASPTGTEEIPRTDLGANQQTLSDSKRRRVT